MFDLARPTPSARLLVVTLVALAVAATSLVGARASAQAVSGGASPQGAGGGASPQGAGGGASPQAQAERSHRLARELESRLTAPCCWNESLALHDSPVARELRAEVETRVAAGEAPSAIERDLIARYGVRIRAVPPTLDDVSTGIVTLLVLAAALLVFFAWRWVRKSKAQSARAEDRRASELSAAETAADGALDQRLREELAALDD
jgi:cytochrome c-type biogenesis protein CcmH